MKFRARVLYENHRSDAKQFGLHDFLCAMVDDAMEMSGRWVAKSYIEGVPRNGRDKLLRDCGERAEIVFGDLTRNSRFAIVDGDKIAEKTGLASGASLEQIRQALPVRYPAVRIVIPDADSPAGSNTEGLLRSLADCLGLSPDQHELQTALGKGRTSLSARDEVFYKALGVAQRVARDRFREKQPTLAGLVDELAELVRPALTAE
jgi:hypothetical protein